MFQPLPARWLAALPLVAALSVSAQPLPSPAPAGPLPQAGPPAYRSALDDYQSFKDEKIVPWQQSNQTVKEIGGWRAYAREASQPETGNGQSPAEAAPAPRSGHGMHH